MLDERNKEDKKILIRMKFFFEEFVPTWNSSLFVLKTLLILLYSSNYTESMDIT
jgi:hypothetical protein